MIWKNELSFGSNLSFLSIQVRGSTDYPVGHELIRDFLPFVGPSPIRDFDLALISGSGPSAGPWVISWSGWPLNRMLKYSVFSQFW